MCLILCIFLGGFWAQLLRQGQGRIRHYHAMAEPGRRLSSLGRSAPKNGMRNGAKSRQTAPEPAHATQRQTLH